MRTINAALMCMALTMGYSAIVEAQCTRDTDCKGSRLCERGRCVAAAKSAIGTPTIGTPIKPTSPRLTQGTVPPKVPPVITPAPVLAPPAQTTPAAPAALPAQAVPTVAPPAAAVAQPPVYQYPAAQGYPVQTVQPQPQVVQPQPVTVAPIAVQQPAQPAPSPTVAIQLQPNPPPQQQLYAYATPMVPLTTPSLQYQYSPVPAASAYAPNPVVVQQTVNPAPAREEEMPDNSFRTAYGALSFAMGAGSWGRMSKDYSDGETIGETTKEGGTPGIHLSGYLVPSTAFHLGAYLRATRGRGVSYTDSLNRRYDDINATVNHLGVGLALKFGKIISERLWFGGALEVGFHTEKFARSSELNKFVKDTRDQLDLDESSIAAQQDSDRFNGLDLSGKFVLDVYLTEIDSFKISVPIAVGAVFVPYAEWQNQSGYDYQRSHWHFSPILQIGIAVGG